MTTAASSAYVPPSPSTFNFRPLSAGMITSETTMAMPNGSFFNLDGYVVTSRGPKKLGGWEPQLRSAATGLPIKFIPIDGSERIESLASLRLTDGNILEFLVTSLALYLVDASAGYTRINWYAPFTIATASQTATNTTLTVTGNYAAAYLSALDKVVFSGVMYPIESFTVGATTLSITFTGIPTLTGVTTFYINKPFASLGSQFVDFVSARQVLYLVDGSTRMIWKMNGALAGDGNLYLQPHIVVGNRTPIAERTIMGATSITFFGERLYFAGILEQEYSGSTAQETTYPTRIRWTDVTDFGKCSAAYYQDVVRSKGNVVKILGMGALLMLYLSDGIYYGRSTNLTTLPYAFSLIETAGITAVGMRAVSTYFDGQIFLGIDNLYFISANASITPLGQNIADSLQDHTKVPYMSSVFVDTSESRILCCVSNTEDVNDCLFILNYHSNGWSMCSMPQFVTPGIFAYDTSLTYAGVPSGDTYDTGTYTNYTYKSLLGGSFTGVFVCFIGSYLMQNTKTLGLNHYMIGDVESITENPGELITPDFDFDDPDKMKTSLRLSLKITDDPETVRTENVYCMVAGSKDRGLTWKELGRMRILPNRDEDALNFRLMGSTLRFRFRFGRTIDGASTDIKPYTISEVILRLRERSVEAQRSNSRE